MSSPFDWPNQIRAALAAWLDDKIPDDLFDVETPEDDDE